VWLALVTQRHVHHPSASKWFDDLDQEPVAFCRITQMGLLRLLTQERVMGEDVVTQQEAWEIYDQIKEDPRIGFLNEPSALEPLWRSFSVQKRPAHHAWTDAYLMAFAKARDLTLVSFDGAIHKSYPSALLLR